MKRLLDVCDLEVRYGTADVLRGVSVHVNDGEIVGVLGSNGAGKSTLMRAISGLVRPVGGQIKLADVDLAGRPPSVILQAGISQVAEGRRIFRQQSVAANLELGAYGRRLARQDLASECVKVFRLFPVLRKKSNTAAAMLSGGEQQMLAIGQALMAAPRLLLMDEPSQGLAPIVIASMVERVRELRRSGLTILIVEQQIALVQALCDRLYIIRNGSVVIGNVTPDELRLEEIRAAYV